MSVILAWIEGIAGLVIAIMGYVFLMPLINVLVHITVNLGAPAGTAYFLQTCAIWGILILGVVSIAYPVLYTFYKQPDQGYR